jgi:hypothetical protein
LQEDLAIWLRWQLGYSTWLVYTCQVMVRARVPDSCLISMELDLSPKLCQLKL